MKRHLSLIVFFSIVVTSAYIGMYINLKNPAQMVEEDGLGLVHVPRSPSNSLQEKTPFLVSVAALADGDAEISEVALYYRDSKEDGAFKRLPLMRVGDSDRYVQVLPGQARAKRNYYFLEVKGNDGRVLRLPKGAPGGNNLYLVKWAASVPRPLIYTHILFMVGAFIMMLHTFYFSLNSLMTGWKNPAIYPIAFFATATFFVAGFPLGLWVAGIAFGIPWGGIPFGWDITDNKTLIAFLYWMAILILYKKNPLRFRGFDSYLIGYKRFCQLTILGAVLTLIVYMIPHSI